MFYPIRRHLFVLYVCFLIQYFQDEASQQQFEFSYQIRRCIFNLSLLGLFLHTWHKKPTSDVKHLLHVCKYLKSWNISLLSIADYWLAWGWIWKKKLDETEYIKGFQRIVWNFFSFFYLTCKICYVNDIGKNVIQTIYAKKHDPGFQLC